jgi:hypothetical protein
MVIPAAAAAAAYANYNSVNSNGLTTCTLIIHQNNFSYFKYLLI